MNTPEDKIDSTPIYNIYVTSYQVPSSSLLEDDPREVTDNPVNTLQL